MDSNTNVGDNNNKKLFKYFIRNNSYCYFITCICIPNCRAQ